jgi:alpha-glucosidase
MFNRSGYFLFQNVFVLLMVALPGLAEWHGVGKMIASPPQGNQIEFHNSTATAVVTVLAPDSVRVRVLQGKTLPPDYSWAVVKTDWPKVAVEFSGSKETRIIRTSELEVRIDLSPFRVGFYNSDGEVISKDSRDMAWDSERVRCWKSMPSDEHYYGLGEKAGPVDKRGHSYVMWNTDPAGYNANTDPMYQTVPFFIGLRKGRAYGVFFDNTYRSSFDMGTASPDEYSFGAQGGEMNYYFFYGPSPAKVIARYTELVGRTELPPLWSIGYTQSSARYEDESTFRFVVENLRRRHIPCDVIFIDTLNHMDGRRMFTWNTKAFPDPQGFLSDLHREGFHFVENIQPSLKVDKNYWAYQEGLAGDHILKKKDGSPFVGYLWAGKCVWPDFTASRTRAWWASLVEHDLKVGIDGILTDMDEPTAGQIPVSQGWVPGGLDPQVVFDDHGLKTSPDKNHNVYGMLETAASRQGMLNYRPNARPFVITRATYAGGQRYAAQWTGDNLATWEDLRVSLRTVLSMGVSGLPFAGTDVGGFVGYPSAQLYTRWLEAGVFHPYFWTHTNDPERPLDPWCFGVKYEAINRRIIELRYRLFPYLYNAFYQETQTGLPIMRPLFLYDPADAKAMDPTPAGENNEFLYGEDLLVAPVVTDAEFQRKVYLPKGTWFDFWSDKIYTGPKTITVPAPIDRIPMFAHGGAVVPMRQVAQYVGQVPIDPLTFEIYPEGHSSRQYYEDDGISHNYRKGVYLLATVSVDDMPRSVKVMIAGREGTYNPPARSLVLKIHGFQSLPRRVELNGREVNVQNSPDLLDKLKEGAAYDSDARAVVIKTPDLHFPLQATVTK